MIPSSDFTFRTYSYSVETLECVIDVAPEILNVRSAGGILTCLIDAPSGYSVDDIELSSITLNGVEPSPRFGAAKGDFDCDGALELQIKFDRATVLSTLEIGMNTLIVTGSVSGLPVEGEVAILVRG